MGFGDHHIYQQVRLEPTSRCIVMKQLPPDAAAPLKPNPRLKLVPFGTDVRFVPEFR